MSVETPTYQQVSNAIALLTQYHGDTCDYKYILEENQRLKEENEKLKEARHFKMECMLDAATDRIEELKEENKKLKEKLKHNVDWRERAKMEEEEEEEN